MNYSISKTILLLLLAALTLGGCKKVKNLQDEQQVKKPDVLAVASNPQLLSTIGTNVQEFNQLKDAAQESSRLKYSFHWTDFDPTGFYVPANTQLNITVEQVSGTALPKLLIGTYYRYKGTQNELPAIIQLTAGLNTITSDQYGGMIWIRFTTTGTPDSKVKITFNSGHLRVPVFIKNQTTQSDWSNQLSTYPSPDVLLIGDHIYQVYARTRAIAYQPQDNNYVISKADDIWTQENILSGLDGSSPLNENNVHSRMLMTETSYVGGYYAAAYYYATSYTPNACADVFTPQITTTAGWTAWHELGHMHQQSPWTWSTLGEVTVNIYALHAERMLGVTPSRLKRDNRWPVVYAYLANTSATKDYNSTPDQTGDAPWVRLYLFHQLWLAFGDSFYIQLHKKTRELTQNPSGDENKMRYFMLTSCAISGKNLTNFFRKWGFKVNESIYTEIANLNLPQPAIEPSTLNEEGTPTIENGAYYKIVSALNNTSVLDVNSNAPTNSTIVSLWSQNNPGTNNQLWLLRRLSGGFYTLKSKADTTKVMDVSGGGSANGTQIIVYQNSGSNNQKWSINDVGNGYYTLSPLSVPNSNVDVNSGSTSNGTKIQIWGAGSGNNQKFKLVKQ